MFKLDVKIQAHNQLLLHKRINITVFTEYIIALDILIIYKITMEHIIHIKCKLQDVYAFAYNSFKVKLFYIIKVFIHLSQRFTT